MHCSYAMSRSHFKSLAWGELQAAACVSSLEKALFRNKDRPFVLKPSIFCFTIISKAIVVFESYYLWVKNISLTVESSPMMCAGIVGSRMRVVLADEEPLWRHRETRPAHVGRAGKLQSRGHRCFPCVRCFIVLNSLMPNPQSLSANTGNNISNVLLHISGLLIVVDLWLLHATIFHNCYK